MWWGVAVRREYATCRSTATFCHLDMPVLIHTGPTIQYREGTSAGSRGRGEAFIWAMDTLFHTSLPSSAGVSSLVPVQVEEGIQLSTWHSVSGRCCTQLLWHNCNHCWLLPLFYRYLDIYLDLFHVCSIHCKFSQNVKCWSAQLPTSVWYPSNQNFKWLHLKIS